ncbi:SulP family inorganic anion transporter [Stutzerimonas xanthomarina]|uniref:Sulfate permease, SulP family n=2 Tax=Stutzerimonas xanthomarina TaxID=271420 RepID=A0A1M5RNP1_9GAMM|nr:sulfate permease [Stutzerimonas xanthomarina]MCP9339211.1 sulfate permease [Stutzerimonas xanthomarina]SEH95510.1 sulfate permease, SulP family [Stutzerimonas xanthomarina]SHH27483.1 sulfate permease, SulP family [Stutzerimonas xanthomarina DSM 18231]
MMQRLARHLPFLEWGKQYDKTAAAKDSLAALIVTLMLIPQSLAYAMLAGLPPVVGLYASILPLIAYTLFGTSRTLAVGPVAVVSLMTAAALGPLFASGSAAYAGAALLLAMMSGAILLAMAVLRLGFLANFLSHPVISGFISASGILIAIGQLKHILGISVAGDNAAQLLEGLIQGLPETHLPTLAIGTTSLVFLFLVRSRLGRWMQRLGMGARTAGTLTKIGPVVALLLAIAAVSGFELAAAGVRVVGEVPQGLPSLSLPPLDLALIIQLLPAAVLISLVGFVESVSVAQTLAAKRRERIEPNQELVALGGANIAAALSGGFPVTGGFARSVVNFDAGAQTPLAGALTAVGIGLTVLCFTPLFHSLPHAVLAATIIVAVLSLVDLTALARTWRYSRQDAASMAATMLGVLLIGVESGILMGVGLSLLLFLWRTSQPHIAVVGQLPGSEHFRNIERFAVVQSLRVLSVRVDESLYFPNARFLEDRIAELLGQHPHAEHLVLMCPGVNLIDASALESLEAISARLHTAGVQLHLSEVKGPVMDRLRGTDFLEHFGGQVFISQYEALLALDPQTTRHALERQRCN